MEPRLFSNLHWSCLCTRLGDVAHTILLFAMLFVIIPVSTWAQWRLQTTLSGNPPLTSIKAVSQDVAWTCSGNGYVYRTTDGGKTWYATTRVSNTEGLGCIEALNATTAFAGGLGPGFLGNANIYRTLNGGQSWQVIYTATGASSAWDWIHFFDAQNGIAMSDPPIAGGSFLIIKTSDGGTTWTPIANLPDANATEWGIINCFDFYDNLNGWFGTAPSGPGGNGGRVFRTIDGGNTWAGFSSGNTAAVSGIRFISPQIGMRIAYNTPPFLTRSVDGGQTWAPMNNLPIANIKSLETMAGINTASFNQIWISGNSNTPFILSSVDGGLSWQQQSIVGNVVGSIYNLSAVSFGVMDDSVQAWGVTVNQNIFTSGGQIFTYRDRIGVATDVKEQTQLPIGYSLSQNYPNPFNPETTIEFQLPQASQVKVVVYNLAGQLVRTLIDAPQAAGRFKLRWDGRDERGNQVASGVYMYELQAGNFRAKNKMILMR